MKKMKDSRIPRRLEGILDPRLLVEGLLLVPNVRLADLLRPV
jgi:hypothetical protein